MYSNRPLAYPLDGFMPCITEVHEWLAPVQSKSVQSNPLVEVFFREGSAAYPAATT
jgi:hypothetical protein